MLLIILPFIQSQTVAFVDATFNSGAFSYDQAKCSRDTGLIVNAIAMDLLQESTSDSNFAGIQYWNQDTYTGQIPSEITATIAAMQNAIKAGRSGRTEAAQLSAFDANTVEIAQAQADAVAKMYDDQKRALETELAATLATRVETIVS